MVFTKLVARLVLIGSLELRANLIEELLVKLVLVHTLLVVSLARGEHVAVVLQILIQRQYLIQFLICVRLIAQTELGVQTERLVLET